MPRGMFRGQHEEEEDAILVFNSRLLIGNLDNSDFNKVITFMLTWGELNSPEQVRKSRELV